jgi:hypothetical protein
MIVTLLIGVARAETAVRSGNHPGFGRIVIDTNGQTDFQIGQDGDHVTLRFPPGVMLGTPPNPPRNVAAIRTDGATIDLTIVHGTKIHSIRLAGRVVIDVLDEADHKNPPAKSGHAGTPHPNPPLVMAASPELGGRTIATPAPAPRAPVEAQALPPADTVKVETTRQTPPGRDVMPENDGPVGLRARRVRLPKDIDGSAILVPFGATTGAAAFRGTDSVYVVFSERRAVDTAALANDPLFGAMTVRLLPNGTLIRLPLPPAVSVALTPMPQGWRIAALTAASKLQPILVSSTDGHLNLTADQPGDIVSLADPETGATLLVGTQHRPGQGLAAPRRTTDVILRTTIQGVVAEPLSDAITLKQAPSGFILSGGTDGLALSPPTSMTDALLDAAHLTRRLDFSNMPGDAVFQRATRQLAEAAASPPLARGPRHHAAAESLMALGLSAEAESLLHMAAEQDPKEAASPDTGALTAIAALLAGRPDEAVALADPRLDGTDEIALWRAIRTAMRDEGSPAAAAVFTATAPLVFQYPASIRDRILPLIIETMIAGGEIGPAARLLNQRKTDPGLAYARALLREAEGDTDQALTMLDALADGHDQFDRARAAIRAVELRLTARRLDKTQAADALDKLLYAWRGDARELALRERIAGLRGQTGAWRAALAILRQAETDFPEQATAIHERLKDMFASMIRDPNEQQTLPIEFVSTVDENTDLMPDPGDDEAVHQALADRLLALDLPARAKPVLEKLMNAAKSDEAKARFGASLATLDARDGDDTGALSVLNASDGPALTPDLSEQRAVLRAEAVAHSGNPAAAAAMLMPLRTALAIESRARILETASDWPGAERAWLDRTALTVPDGGMLDDTQARIALRLATATARAADDAGLAALRARYGNRIGTGPVADMFRLLTAEPVRTSGDIKRSQQEMNVAASLPADLNALRASTMTR